MEHSWRRTLLEAPRGVRAEGVRDGLPDSGVMGRPKVCRLRQSPDPSTAASGARYPRPGCEIEWGVGLVARRIQRRPVLAVLAAGSGPRNSQVRRRCRGKLLADGRLCLAAVPFGTERPPLRLDPAIRSTARCAKVLIGRPERGNLRDDEQLLIVNLLDHVPTAPGGCTRHNFKF